MRPSLPSLLLLLVPLVWAQGCATTPEQRADRLWGESESLLEDAERQLRALKVEEAERTLAWAEDRLGAPDLELHPESSLLRQRHAELVARLEGARVERAAQSLALEVARQRQALERARTKLLEAAHAAEPLEAGRAPLGAIRGEAQDLLRQVQEGKALEARSEEYAVDAGHAARSVERILRRAELLERRAEFIEGPLGAWRRASEREEAARTSKVLEEQRDALAAAQSALAECRERGQTLLVAAPQLEAEHVAADLTAGGAVAGCTKRGPRVAKQLAAVEKKVARKVRAEAKRSQRTRRK